MRTRLIPAQMLASAVNDDLDYPPTRSRRWEPTCSFGRDRGRTPCRGSAQALRCTRVHPGENLLLPGESHFLHLLTPTRSHQQRWLVRQVDPPRPYASRLPLTVTSNLQLKVLDAVSAFRVPRPLSTERWPSSTARRPHVLTHAGGTDHFHLNDAQMIRPAAREASASHLWRGDDRAPAQRKAKAPVRRPALLLGAVVEPGADPAVVEAVVDDEGNAVIPAEQLPERLPAGTHLRVHLEPVVASRRSVEGLLPDLPELSWEDFEAASRLAVRDAEGGRRAS